jgi:hypothetical protein
MKKEHNTVFFILLLISVSFLFTACTREAQKRNSQVTIHFPDSISSSVASVETGNKLVSGKPNFDYGLTPSDYSQVDCLIVFVGGPEELMRSNSCEKSSDKSQGFKFGVFAGAMGKEQTITLEVPSGASRTIRLYGMKKPTATALCPGIVAAGADSLLSGFSAPYFLGESKPTEMLPGTTVSVEIPVVAAIDSSAYFDDCMGPSFGSGTGPGGGSNDPGKPYLRIEGLHTFNKVENPSFARPLVRGACYPITFKTFKPCTGGVCEAYALQNLLTINTGPNIKIFTSEGDCQSDSFAVSSFNILPGQTQIPVSGNYFLRVPLGQIGMFNTDLSNEVSISGTEEVNFNQPLFTNIDIAKPKITFSNLPSSISYGSCASGTNTSLSVYEDSAATIPMNSHQVLPFDGLFLMAKNLGCSTQVSAIPGNVPTITVNLAKPVAASSGISGSVVNSVIFDSASGKYYVAGQFTAYGGKTVGNIIRLNPDGSYDPIFDSGLGFDGAVNSIVSDGTGGVFVAGTFLNYKGIAVKRLAKLDQSGKLDLNFGFDFNGAINAMKLSGSRLYVAGSFTQINSQTRNYIASLELSTKTLTSWDPNLNAASNALAIDGTTAYVGGSFTTVNGGAVRNRLAALDLATGTATAWNPNISAGVSALAINGSNLYVGGSFTTVNGGTVRNRLAALDLATGTATAWNPNISGTIVSTIEVRSPNVVAGGSFTQAGSTTVNKLAAVDNTTGAVASFELNPYWGSLIFNPLFYDSIGINVGP